MPALSDRKRSGQTRPGIDDPSEASTIPAGDARRVHGRVTTGHLNTDGVIVRGVIVAGLQLKRQKTAGRDCLQSRALKDIGVVSGLLATEDDGSSHN